MSDVSTKAQDVKNKISEIFDYKSSEIDSRVEQLRRIKTTSQSASEASTQKAIAEAEDYLKTLGVVV